jgi:hypothetical protein
VDVVPPLTWVRSLNQLAEPVVDAHIACMFNAVQHGYLRALTIGLGEYTIQKRKHSVNTCVLQRELLTRFHVRCLRKGDESAGP